MQENAGRNNLTVPFFEIQSSNLKLLMTRRHFLYGMLGVGALATLAGGPLVADEAFAADSPESSGFSYLEVPEDAVFDRNACSEVAALDSVDLTRSFELPYGTLVWAHNDSLAALLLPTENSDPLTRAGILDLQTGSYITILEAAIGHDQDYDIYDIRVSENGVIWTEVNILSGIWHIYTATFSGNTLGEPVKVDEGEVSGWETPCLATVGSNAFWQVLPTATGPYSTEHSLLKRASFGSANVDTVYSSLGRMSTPPYPLSDSLVITPRANTDAVHYQLTLLDAASGEVKDSLTLPQAMRPLEAGYGKTGFNFSFDGIYNYGGGIANLGTYTPQNTHEPSQYSGLTWFRFNNEPTAPPAWCGDLFIVKGLSSVFGVNLSDKTFFYLDVESGSDSYGDYLASIGENRSFVTYANINSLSIEGEKRVCCLVRVWTPKNSESPSA